MGMLGLYYAGIWKRMLPFLAWVALVWLAHAQTTEDEMLDQLLFGDDLPSLETESVAPGTPVQPADEQPSPGIGDYHTGVPGWDKDFSARMDLGYADNVLLSPFDKDGSGFLRSSFDAFLYRPLSDAGFQTYLYAFGEINAYEEVEGMDASTLFMLQTEIGWMATDGVETGFQMKYTFYDQVYDASFNEFYQASTTVQANQFEIRPFLRSPVGEKSYVGAELAVVRIFYENSAEDYYENHVRFFLGRRYGHGSKVEIDLDAVRREYDERPYRDRSGFPLGGTLKRGSLGGGVNWSHSFGEHRIWQTRTSGEFLAVMDDDLGYYDYDLGRVRASLIRSGAKWKTTATLGFSHYDYQTQLGDDGRSNLHRQTIETALSTERSFGEKWTGFLEWRREQDFSNIRSYEYNANVLSIGGERSL